MEAELISSVARHGEPAITEPPPAEPDVGIPEAPVQIVANQLSDVAVDAVRLVELQIKLFEAECRQSVRQLGPPAAILAVTGLIAMAVAVVLLVGLGTGLHELTGWPLSVCLLLASFAGIGGAVLAVRQALELLKTPRISFDKSKAELMRNVELLSRVLKSR